MAIVHRFSPSQFTIPALLLPLFVPASFASDNFPRVSQTESGTAAARLPLVTRRTDEAAPAKTSSELTRKIRARLVAAGWRVKAADTVVRLNAGWFLLMDQENRAELQHQLTALADLGKHQEELGDLLEEHPETAGLLAGVSDPKRVADTLRNAGDAYPLLAGLYFRHATGRDALDLARALETNRDRIIRLTRRGLIGSEVMFLFPRKNVGDRAYERWLQEQVDATLSRSDEELASLLQLALNQGPKLHVRLQQDKHFRAEFRSTLWPRLVRAAGSQGGMFEAFLDEPLLWDFLDLPDGEKLVTDWGKLPIPLLVGERAYAKDQRALITQAFLNDDKQMIEALVVFLDQPLFHKLLGRPLDPATRKAAFRGLLAAQPNHSTLLQKFDGLTDAALKAEVGPPPDGVVTWAPGYRFYLLGNKLYQGRDPTTADWFEAGLAVADFLPMVKGGVIAAKGGVTILRTGAIAGKVTGKVFTTTLRKVGTSLAVRKLGHEAAAQLAKSGLEKELVKWSITGTMAGMQRTWQTAAHKLLTFEVTRPVRFMYHYGGFKRETFRRLSTLEARLFMRKDGQVFLHVGNLQYTFLGKGPLRYLNDYAEHHAKRFLQDTFDDPTRELPRPGPPSLSSAVMAEVNDAWLRHAAAWWLHQLGRPN